MLNGQSECRSDHSKSWTDRPSELQGIHTAKDVHHFLKSRNRVEGYPLFETIYQICWHGTPVDKLTARL